MSQRFFFGIVQSSSPISPRLIGIRCENMSLNNSVNVLPVSNSDPTGTILDHHTNEACQQSFQNGIGSSSAAASGNSGNVAGFGNIYDDQTAQNRRSESFSFGQLDNISSFADLAEFATGRKGSLPCIRSVEPRFRVPSRRATDPIGLYPDDPILSLSESPKQRFAYIPNQSFHDRLLAKKNRRARKLVRPRFEFRYPQDFQPYSIAGPVYQPQVSDALPEYQPSSVSAALAAKPSESRGLASVANEQAAAISSRQFQQQLFSNISYQSSSSRSRGVQPRRRSELSPSPLNQHATLAERANDDGNFILPTDTLINTGSSGSIFSTVSHDANSLSSITPRSPVEFSSGIPEARDNVYPPDRVGENPFQAKYFGPRDSVAANLSAPASQAVNAIPGVSISPKNTFNDGPGGALYGRSSSLDFRDTELRDFSRISLCSDDRPDELQSRKAPELSLAESGIEYGDPVMLKLLKPRKRKKYGDYKCLHCGRIFPNVVVFAKHLDENRLIRFKPPADLRESQYLYGTNAPGSESSMLIASRKVTSVDGMKMNVCGIKGCGRMFKRKDSLRRHERLVHENRNSRFNQHLRMQCIVLGDHNLTEASD